MPTVASLKPGQELVLPDGSLVRRQAYSGRLIVIGAPGPARTARQMLRGK